MAYTPVLSRTPTSARLAFGTGILASAEGRRVWRVLGVGMLACGAVGAAGPFAPIHLRGAARTATDTVHIVATVVLVVLALAPDIAVWAPTPGLGALERVNRDSRRRRP